MSEKKNLELARDVDGQEDLRNATFQDDKSSDSKSRNSKQQFNSDPLTGELPPTYKSLNVSHHPYNTTNQHASSSKPAGQGYTGGSCGVPASVIQGVLGPPQPKGQKAGSKSSWLSFRGSKGYKESAPVWNMDGVRLNQFGGPFSRSKK